MNTMENKRKVKKKKTLPHKHAITGNEKKGVGLLAAK